MKKDICHCVVLRKATRKITSYYDEALAPLGINVAQFSLLRHINHMAPVSLTDLGARVELDRSTVGRNAKVLERMGLAIIRPGKDQREATLTVSEAGQGVLRAGAPLWDAVQADIEARLGPGGIEHLRGLLAAL